MFTVSQFKSLRIILCQSLLQNLVFHFLGLMRRHFCFCFRSFPILSGCTDTWPKNIDLKHFFGQRCRINNINVTSCYIMVNISVTTCSIKHCRLHRCLLHSCARIHSPCNSPNSDVVLCRVIYDVLDHAHPVLCVQCICMVSFCTITYTSTVYIIKHCLP